MKPGSWMFGEWHIIHFEDPETPRDALANVVEHGFIPRKVVWLLDEDGVNRQDEAAKIPPKDFAKVLCRDYPQSAPRIFFEKA